MDKQTEKPKRKYTKKPKPKQLEPQDEQPKPVQKVIIVRFP